MLGAIGVSAVLRGGTMSLTLAPALLLAITTLALLGPGRLSLDAWPLAPLATQPDRV